MFRLSWFHDPDEFSVETVKGCIWFSMSMIVVIWLFKRVFLYVSRPWNSAFKILRKCTTYFLITLAALLAVTCICVSWHSYSDFVLHCTSKNLSNCCEICYMLIISNFSVLYNFANKKTTTGTCSNCVIANTWLLCVYGAQVLSTAS